jgi:CMP-N-acetylneuraminic acid synthetase
MILKTIALLPLKANSERVPRKNFRSFCGKPLFRWMLDTLLGMPEVELIVINTDARHELTECGLEPNSRVLIRERKPELCGDFISMNSVIADDIVSVKSETYLMTHTTNPLLSEASIRGALAAYYQGTESAGRDSLFTVNKFQARFYRLDGSAVNHDPSCLIRTQDLEPCFEENSNLYIFSADSFRVTGARIGQTPILFETPKRESVDIDDEESWHIAEALAHTYHQR